MADNQDFVMTDAEAYFVFHLVLHLVRVRLFAEAYGIPVEVAGPIYERLEQARRDALERELQAAQNGDNREDAGEAGNYDEAGEDNASEENINNADDGDEDNSSQEGNPEEDEEEEGVEEEEEEGDQA